MVAEEGSTDGTGSPAEGDADGAAGGAAAAAAAGGNGAGGRRRRRGGVLGGGGGAVGGASVGSTHAAGADGDLNRNRKAVIWSTVGTPDYMAPEILLETGYASGRVSDGQAHSPIAHLPLLPLQVPPGLRLVVAGRRHVRNVGRVPSVLRRRPADDVPQDPVLQGDPPIPSRGRIDARGRAPRASLALSNAARLPHMAPHV